jgi:BMFP domain-containing protein YqiC
MGGGTSWDVSTYSTKVTESTRGGGSYFGYSSKIESGEIEAKVHEMLDPSKLNKAGINIRESFDSDAHPSITSIAIIFDVTGSMRSVPKILVENLPALNGVLQRKGYIEEPQLLFGAVGDAKGDKIPLQIGQFEIGNEMDDVLSNIVLEGGGGGGNHESYELALYYLARHTNLDSLNKRNKKGYLFMIADERLYGKVSKKEVENIIGDILQEDISTFDIINEIREKFEVILIFPNQSGYIVDDSVYKKGHNDDNVVYWEDVVEQNIVVLEDAKDICETIALTIATFENIDLDEVSSALKEFGSKDSSIKSAEKAISLLKPSINNKDKSVVITGEFSISDNKPIDRL